MAEEAFAHSKPAAEPDAQKPSDANQRVEGDVEHQRTVEPASIDPSAFDQAAAQDDGSLAQGDTQDADQASDTDSDLASDTLNASVDDAAGYALVADADAALDDTPLASTQLLNLSSDSTGSDEGGIQTPSDPDAILIAQAAGGGSPTASDAASAGGDAAAAGTAETATVYAAPLPFAGAPLLAVIGGVAVVAAAAGGGSTAAAAVSATPPGGTTPGGSGGGGTTPPPVVATTITKGVVIDGPVVGATVFYDENANGKLDAGEVSGPTASDGSYTLENFVRTPNGKIVVLPGGLDTYTGQTIGYLAATEGTGGVTVVTPISYLLATTNLTQSEVKAALGIPESVNLDTFDPIAAMKSGDATQAAIGEKFYTAQQQIYTVMTAAAQEVVSSTPTTSSFIAIGNIADAMASAIRTASVLSSSQGSGAGLMDTITTFAVAAASGVNVAALEGKADALTQIHTALATNTTATTILSAVQTVNHAITTNYAGIAADMASGGGMSAHASASAAISQTLLLTSIDNAVSTGSAAGLQVLSSSATLDTVVNQVAQQITSAPPASNGAFVITPPQTLTVTVTEAQARVAANNPYSAQDVVLLKVADGEVATVASNAAAFKNIGVDLISAADGTLAVTTAQAQAIIGGSLVFTGSDTVSLLVSSSDRTTIVDNGQAWHDAGVDEIIPAGTAPLQIAVLDAVLLGGVGLEFHNVIAEVGANDLASAVTHAHDLASAGIDSLVATAPLNITVAQAEQLLGHLAFTQTGAGAAPVHVTVTSAADVGDAVLHAADLHTVGVSALDSTTDAMSVTAAQATSLMDAGIGFTPADTVTEVVTSSDMATVSANATNTVTAGIDFLHGQDITLTQTEASQLVSAGLDFDASSVVTMQADGTHLSTSLKDLQKIGVDFVPVAGDAPADIAVDLGATGVLSAAGIPAFDAQDHVELRITDTQVSEAAHLAAALHAANIDTIGAADHTLDLNAGELDAFLSAGVSFEPDNTVVANVAPADITPVISDVAAFAAAHPAIPVGLDTIDVTTDMVTITDAQATTLVQAGIEFAAADHVSVQADGTHLSTSLKDLQKIGVDFIPIAGDASAHIAVDLGTTGDLSPTGIPAFDAPDHVELRITDTQVSEAAGLASALHAANIDTIGAADHTLDLNASQLDTFLSAGVSFEPNNTVVADIAPADITPVVDHVAAFTADHPDIPVGLDTIDVTSNAVDITEAQAVTLVQAGIDFAPADDVTVQADGTHVSTSLKDLHDLGVDHVNVDAAAAAANPGHDAVLDLGFVPTAGADNAVTVTELVQFLDSMQGHGPMFNTAADVEVELPQAIENAVDSAAPAVHDHIVTDLVNLGIDYVKVVGTDTEHDLHNP